MQWAPDSERRGAWASDSDGHLTAGLKSSHECESRHDERTRTSPSMGSSRAHPDDFNSYGRRNWCNEVGEPPAEVRLRSSSEDYRWACRPARPLEATPTATAGPGVLRFIRPLLARRSRDGPAAVNVARGAPVRAESWIAGRWPDFFAPPVTSGTPGD